MLMLAKAVAAALVAVAVTCALVYSRFQSNSYAHLSSNSRLYIHEGILNLVSTTSTCILFPGSSLPCLIHLQLLIPALQKRSLSAYVYISLISLFIFYVGSVKLMVSQSVGMQRM